MKIGADLIPMLIYTGKYTEISFLANGVSINGVITNSWMVYFMEKSKEKWMMTGRTPKFNGS